MLLFAPKDLDFTRNIKSTFLTLNIRGGLKSPSYIPARLGLEL